jgi:hypothetical protein
VHAKPDNCREPIAQISRKNFYCSALRYAAKLASKNSAGFMAIFKSIRKEIKGHELFSLLGPENVIAGTGSGLAPRPSANCLNQAPRAARRRGDRGQEVRMNSRVPVKTSPTSRRIQAHATAPQRQETARL